MSSSATFLDCNIHSKFCAGPEQTSHLIDPPENVCRKYSLKEILQMTGDYISSRTQDETRTSRNEIGLEMGKLCSCTSDYCNNQTPKNNDQCSELLFNDGNQKIASSIGILALLLAIKIME